MNNEKIEQVNGFAVQYHRWASDLPGKWRFIRDEEGIYIVMKGKSRIGSLYCERLARAAVETLRYSAI
jgi:hypothetical protein